MMQRRKNGAGVYSSGGAEYFRRTGRRLPGDPLVKPNPAA
jgi:hypothetical protein